MKEYLVVDYSNVTDPKSEKPSYIRFIGFSDLLNYLDTNRDKQIAVFEIGNCLLDWS